MKHKYAFVKAQAKEYLVTIMCHVLGLVRSGYYAWQRVPQSARHKRDLLLTTEIKSVFAASRQTYGSPRVHAELAQRPALRAKAGRVLDAASSPSRSPQTPYEAYDR